MDLKVGDLVAFKKYEDMVEWVRLGISKDCFPEFGKVSGIYKKAKRFFIEGQPYMFSQESIDYIIVKATTKKINVGDEVLVKTTVSSTHDNLVWLSPLVFKDNVVKVLKCKEEHFVVQEDHYGMYIGVAGELVGSKDTAQVFTSRNTANETAADMHLNAWEVINCDA